MRADGRPAHRTWVLVHTLLPVIADALHGGDAAVAIAAVVDVLARADGHFGQRLGRHFLRGFVDVGADGGPEAVDDVDEEEDEEEVEQELGVVGEDVWEVGVRVDEGEHGGDEPDLAWLGGLLRGRVRAVAAAGPGGVRVLVRAAVGKALFALSSLAPHALGDAVGVDVSAGEFASAGTGGELAVHGEERVLLFISFLVAVEVGDGIAGLGSGAAGGFRGVFVVGVVRRVGAGGEVDVYLAGGCEGLVAECRGGFCGWSFGEEEGL